MGEYRHSGHAVCDIKYHLVWITKYRYKILRGEVAERTRDLIRQICHAREVVIVRGSVSPDHIHMLVSAPAHLAPRSLCNTSKADRRACCRKNSQAYGSVTGASICGRVDTFARRWAQWMRKRSKPTSRIKSGMKMIKASGSLRLPSLEPALSRESFRGLQ